MPTNKDLKRLTRTRMRKTGESYTTARAQLVRKKKRSELPPVPADHEAVTGMSDAAVKAKTGRTWKQWVSVLDAADAHTLSHRDIARHLAEDHGVAAWWSQMVTVGYERLRGLRDVGQRRGGGYDVNKSKTLPVPVSRLYRAFRDVRQRRRWMDADGVEVTSATPDKVVHMRWPDGTRVSANFTAKAKEKSTVAVQHRQLASKAAADEVREAWTVRLAELAEIL